MSMNNNIKQKTVLIIYNNYDVKDYVDTLRNNNILVLLYSDPILALKEYKPRFYDLILLETRLTTMSGFEFYSLVSKIESIPVCFLTNLSTYYSSLQNFYHDIDIGCFISLTHSADTFLELIQMKLNN